MTLKLQYQLQSKFFNVCDPLIFLYSVLLGYPVFTPYDWLHGNQYGRIVQLLAQQGRNIGFVHFQTPANAEAIQIAACVVGWVRREQKYYGACKLLTKSEDNTQPENCSQKQTEFTVRSPLPIVTWRGPTLVNSDLRIKRPLQGGTCRAGLLWEDWEKTELQ